MLRLKRTMCGFIRKQLGAYLSDARMISRDVWLYIFALALVWFNFQVFSLILNLYLQAQGYVTSEIGWVNSLFAWGLSIMVLPSAFVMSRVRFGLLVRTSIILFALFSVAMCTVSPFWAVLGFAVLSGTMLAAIRVTAGPFFMCNASSRERATVFSFSSAADVFAGVVAFAVAGKLAMLIDKWVGDIVVSYRYTLYMGSIVSLLALIPLLALKQARPPSDTDSRGVTWRQLRTRWPLYRRILLLGSCVGLSAGVILPFLNLFVSDQFGADSDVIGWLFAAATLATFIGAMAGPIVVRSIGLTGTLIAIHIASIPFIVVMAYASHPGTVFTAVIIRCGIMGMSFPLVSNFCLELCRPDERGAVNGLTLFSINFSWMIAMAIGGYLIEGFGYTFTFNVMIVLYIATALVLFACFGKAERHVEN